MDDQDHLWSGHDCSVWFWENQKIMGGGGGKRLNSNGTIAEALSWKNGNSKSTSRLYNTIRIREMSALSESIGWNGQNKPTRRHQAVKHEIFTVWELYWTFFDRTQWWFEWTLMILAFFFKISKFIIFQKKISKFHFSKFQNVDFFFKIKISKIPNLPQITLRPSQTLLYSLK